MQDGQKWRVVATLQDDRQLEVDFFQDGAFTPGKIGKGLNAMEIGVLQHMVNNFDQQGYKKIVCEKLDKRS